MQSEGVKVPMRPTGEEQLRKRLMEVSIDSGLTCKEVLSALGYVQARLRQKGYDLLDGISIQEVAKVE